MDKRLTCAIGVAAVVHVAVFAAIRVHQGSAPSAASEEDLVAVIDFPDSPDPRSPFSPSTATASTESNAPVIALRDRGPRAPSHPADAPASTASSAMAGSPPTAASSEAVAVTPKPKGLPGDSLIPSLVGPASGHAVIWSTTPPLSKEIEAAKRLDRAIAAGLDAAAVDTTGGFGGPVVTAAHDASYGRDAPDTGRAMLDVTIDSKGVVTRVDLVSHDDLVGWQAVARAMKLKLAKQTLRVPSGSGVVVRVSVESAMRLPSGTKGGPSVHIEGVGIGGTFDLADIGAKPMRVVAVKVVSEKRTD